MRSQLSAGLKALKPFCRKSLAVMRRGGVREVRNTGFESVSEEMRSGLDGPVNGRIVGEHERGEIELPIKRVGVDQPGEVFGDELVHDLGLSIALRMIGGGNCVLNFEERIQFVGKVGAKFFSPVGDNFKRQAVTADPAVEDGIADRGRLLVGQSQDLRVFVEGIGNAKNIFLARFRRAKRTKEIRVDALIRRRALRKRMEDIGCRAIVGADELAPLASTEFAGDILIHTRPVVGLEDAFLGLGDTTMTCEETTMGLVDDVGH